MSLTSANIAYSLAAFIALAGSVAAWRFLRVLPFLDRGDD
jgi:hypothetical protein